MSEELLRLEATIRAFDGAVVAFSGGADSALVLAVAHRVLGDRAIGLTAVSPSLAERERRLATDFARAIGVALAEVSSSEVSNPDYAANPVNRCYFCKSELYTICLDEARKRGFHAVFDGLNVDDLTEERPGALAAREKGVVHPLIVAGLGKEAVRRVSRELALPTWDKVASPCLASRIPFGRPISAAALRQVELCENFLKDAGLRVVRVRHLGDTALVEVGLSELGRLDDKLRRDFEAFARQVGFERIEVSKDGYRFGGANIPLQLGSVG